VPSKEVIGEECTICLSSFCRREVVVELPCRHKFHNACIGKWLTECRKTCPLCGEAVSA